MCMREMASSKGHKEGRKEGRKERERNTYEQRKERINIEKNESDGQGFLVVVGLLLVDMYIQVFLSFFSIVSQR